MGSLRRINGGGSWTNISITGTNRNIDVGLIVNVPEYQTLVLSNVSIRNVFIPLIKVGKGTLIWDRLSVSDFGGDASNIRAKNVYGNKLIIRDNTPTRPYQTCIRKGNESIEACLERYGEVVHDPKLLSFSWLSPTKQCLKGYHCDGVSQMYSVKEDGYTLDPEGTISDIRIRSIDAELQGKNTQALMGSEVNRYTRLNLGEEQYRIITDGYPYHAVFNQLDSSSIGGANNCVTLGSRLRVLAVKPTKHHTFNNTYPGFSNSTIVGDRDVKSK